MKNLKASYRIINIISLLVFIVSIVALILYWKEIPDTIPTHYNGAGIPDNYGDKSILILLIFAEVFTLGTMVFAMFVVKLTMASNHENVKEGIIEKTIYPMLAVLNLLLVLMFAYMIYCSATCKALGKAFMPVVLIGSFLPIVYYLYKYCKEVNRNPLKEQKDLNSLDETNPIKVCRSKVDWWIGAVLAISLLLPLVLGVIEFIDEGTFDIGILITVAFLALIILPLCDIKYILYDNHLTVRCSIYGTHRILYSSITNIKKTSNPLSSAALSTKRIQIDYVNQGSHGMILISPKDRDAFIQFINHNYRLSR